jgi:hypothetical protein
MLTTWFYAERMARAAVFALLGLLVAAPAAAHGVARIGAFKTPSGNIVCGYAIDVHGSASMECGIKSGLKPPPRRIHCLAGDPNDKRVSLRRTGRAAPVLCAGDPGPLLPQIEARARVLAYGRTIRFGGIRCSSATTGLTCRNRSGHGFFLSRERWRAF